MLSTLNHVSLQQYITNCCSNNIDFLNYSSEFQGKIRTSSNLQYLGVSKENSNQIHILE